MCSGISHIRHFNWVGQRKNIVLTTEIIWIKTRNLFHCSVNLIGSGALLDWIFKALKTNIEEMLIAKACPIMWLRLS